MAVTTETKVGAFVLVGAALLVAFVLALTHVRLSPGLTVYADFDYAGSLQPGAAVKFSGIAVGQVSRLTLLPAHPEPAAATSRPGAAPQPPPVLRAELVLDDAAKLHLHPDSTFAVATQGVIGEAYLELIEGPGEQPLEPQAGVRGIDAPRLYTMARNFSLLLEAATAGLAAADEAGFVGAAGMAGTASTAGTAGTAGTSGAPGTAGLAALANSGRPGSAAPEPVLQAIGRLVTTLNDVLGQRREALLTGIDNLSASAADTRVLTRGLRVAVGDGESLRLALREARQATGRLNSQLPHILKSSNHAVGALDSLSSRANSTFDQVALTAGLADARLALANLQSVVAEVQTLVRGIKHGEGTVGGFMEDPQIYKDMKEMMGDLKQHPWKLIWK
jgi:phospholipid/cholesterol/gamma-HCH transport system substrate-binding protein